MAAHPCVATVPYLRIVLSAARCNSFWIGLRLDRMRNRARVPANHGRVRSPDRRHRSCCLYLLNRTRRERKSIRPEPVSAHPGGREGKFRIRVFADRHAPTQGAGIGEGLQADREGRSLRQAGLRQALLPHRAICLACADEAPGPWTVPSADPPRHRRARRLPPRVDFEPDGMFLHGCVALPSCCSNTEGDIRRVGVGRGRQSPHQAVVACSGCKPEPHMQAAGEAAREGREAICRLGLPAGGGRAAPVVSGVNGVSRPPLTCPP